MADPAYQQAHLGFLSNASGTTYHEVQLTIVIPLLSSLVHGLHSVWTSGARWQPFSEFIFVFVPQLALVTVLNQHSLVAGAVSYMIFTTLCVLVLLRARQSDKSCLQIAVREMEKAKNYLNVYRGSILILTVICILAVDFPSFPRRFAKTKVYGFGLMDVGIGMFFVTNGIVSHEARGIHLGVKKKLKHLLTSCIPLLVLGFGRLFVVTITGYHNPVSEYGVHWNFFLSLALMKISTTIIFTMVSPKHSLCLAILLILTYQWALNHAGLTEFILDDAEVLDMTDGPYRYFYDNRSGILSCVGSLSIYFVSVKLGQFIFLRKRETFRQCLVDIVQLYGMWVVLTGILSFTHIYVQPASRKLCNLTFVLWATALTLHCLAVLMTGDLVARLLPKVMFFSSTGKIAKSKKHLREHKSLFQYVNKNGLFYFLIGNISTGVVNLSMKTIYATPSIAFFTMICYLMFTFLLVIKKQGFYDDRQIKIINS